MYILNQRAIKSFNIRHLGRKKNEYDKYFFRVNVYFKKHFFRNQK